MVRKRAGSFWKYLKDYIVPIIWLGLIVLLIYSVFSGSSTNETANSIKYENQIGLDVTLDNDLTDGYIVYPGENKKKIEGAISLYKWERILVKEGSVSLDFPSVWNFRLDKNGDVKYDENGDLSLKSSDFWANTESKLTINMEYAKVFVWENSHVSLSQNEVESTIYLLSGTAEVRNLSWISSVLWAGQKVAVSRLNASNDNFDLSLQKEDLDDFFQSSDWFIKNNGSSFLAVNSEEQNALGSTESGTPLLDGVISFNDLVDESYVSSDSINISGTYVTENNVSIISLNWVEATLDEVEGTFDFEWVDTGSRENDLVFKVYDDSNDLLSKFIYVVYHQWWEADDVSTGGFNVKHYDVDGSKFTFTAPTTKDTFSTSATFVTIKGAVLEKWVTKVSVNGYDLKSFNGSTWRYHADVRYNNLKTGTNIYEVKYFDSTGKVIYINNFKIVKKLAGSSIVPTTETYSDETSVQ